MDYNISMFQKHMDNSISVCYNVPVQTWQSICDIYEMVRRSIIMGEVPSVLYKTGRYVSIKWHYS